MSQAASERSERRARWRGYEQVAPWKGGGPDDDSEPCLVECARHRPLPGRNGVLFVEPDAATAGAVLRPANIRSSSRAADVQTPGAGFPARRFTGPFRPVN